MKRPETAVTVYIFIIIVILAFLSGCTGTSPGISPKVTPYPVPGTGCGTTTTATVTDIVDGDTIHVRMADGTKEKVRFLGIDTPETDPEGNNPREYAPLEDTGCLAAWGKVAKGRLASLVLRKQVVLEPDCREGNRDTYGRLLVYVSLPDGTDLNALMLREGLARAYTKTSAERLPSYISLEKTAREKGTGMWGQANLECRYPD